jgi:hypothetical protein
MWAVGHARPIEHALGQPVLSRGVALRILTCGFLRHFDDELDPGFLGGLCELGGGLNDAGTDRIAEIRALHAVQCCSHRIEVEKVAINDLCPELLEPF